MRVTCINSPSSVLQIRDWWLFGCSYSGKQRRVVCPPRQTGAVCSSHLSELWRTTSSLRHAALCLISEFRSLWAKGGHPCLSGTLRVEDRLVWEEVWVGVGDTVGIDRAFSRVSCTVKRTKERWIMGGGGGCLVGWACLNVIRRERVTKYIYKPELCVNGQYLGLETVLSA